MASVRRNFLQLAAGAVAAPLIAQHANGQTYPAHPVRMVVGFPEGGPIDIAARLIAPWLSQRLGQPFIVENRPGESGAVATGIVAQAAPDGHTLLLCGPVNIITPFLFAGQDFRRDMAPVASLYRVPLVVEVNPGVAARTIPALLAYAKAHPGELKVGYAGRGTPQHVAIEYFKMMAGVDLTLVAYPGSTPALADLLAGRVQIMFDPLPSSIALVRSGRLVPLAVTTPTRCAALPQTPSVAEFVPGYEADSWFGIGAPMGTPKGVVDMLNAEINAGLASPAIAARLADIGGTAMPGSAAHFVVFIDAESEKYATIIRAAKISAS